MNKTWKPNSNGDYRLYVGSHGWALNTIAGYTYHGKREVKLYLECAIEDIRAMRKQACLEDDESSVQWCTDTILWMRGALSVIEDFSF